MDKDSKYLLRKIITDFLCLFIVAFPILLFYLFGKPYERGFFCNDESLKHPYKESTISSAALYGLGMFVPILSFLFIEYIHYKNSNGQVARMFLGRTVNPWIWNCYKVIGVFGFAVACSHMTTDVGKYIIGRLRPHFFDVCQPNVNCTDPQNLHLYIDNFVCQGPRKELFKELRLSFPSGHSSFSAVTMIYLVLYLQARMTWRGSKLLRHFLQYLCILLAVVTPLSRVSDYKHHWSDVLAGSTLGAFVAVIVALFVSDLFTCDRSNSLPVTDADADSPSQAGKGRSNQIC